VLLRRLAALTFTVAGALHFAIPKTYEAIVPPYLPAHRELVYASGVAEMIGGVGLLTRRRRAAGWWLIATLAAVFPANLHMALHPEDYKQVPGGAAALWARLPFQLVFVGWVRRAMRP
jgi:uncharacterized membrane protein